MSPARAQGFERQRPLRMLDAIHQSSEEAWSVPDTSGDTPAMLADDAYAAAEWLAMCLDPRVRAIGRAIGCWYDEGATTPIGNALGLIKRGGRSVKVSRGLASRDAHLRQLWHTHAPYSALTALPAAKAIASQWQRYASDRWKRDKTNLSPPASDPARTFYLIMKDGNRPIKSARVKQVLEE